VSKFPQEFKGKSSWERARTRLSKLVGLMALLIAATTQSNWVLRHEPLAMFLYPLGLVIVAVASSGRTWCSFYLSGRKDSVLTVDGPYSLCRNPLYFFSSLGAIGVGLCTETLAYPALILVIFAIYYPGIIRREEARLGEMFGEAYIQYRLRAPVFFPSFELFTEPQSWSANPRLFRRHLTDDTMFVFVAAVLGLIGKLRSVGIIPQMFQSW
jgi:protein-S-isoprenylcysteine O-methyltransferase Ste14